MPHALRPSVPPAEEPADGQPKTALRFLALGDSYTIGEGVAEQERWPVQLARVLRESGVNLADPTIIARTGWTTSELKSGMDLSPPQGTFDLVTLQIGVNNQFRGLDEAEFERDLAELLQRAIACAGGRSQSVIVLSIPDWSVTPFAQGRDRNTISAAIDRFNALNQRWAARLGCRYVDVTAESRRADADNSLLADDGLHPSASMYSHWVALTLPNARQILEPDAAG
ncbi:MAG: SGNH/GDSL hydrolase family protein [Planctomycetaceae bacterium]